MPESAVKVLAANADQSGKAKTALAVNTQTWVAEVIKPTMPAGGSTTYRIAEATINFGKVAGQTGTGAYNIEIRNIDASGKPLANGAPNAVIDRVVVPAASLATVAAGAQPPRVTLAFTGSVQIPRVNGFAVCVCPQTGAPNGVVGMQAGGTQNPTTMTYCTSTNAGVAWGTPATDRDFLVEIKGTVTMARDTSAELDLAWHLDDGAATLSNVLFSNLNWYAQMFAIDWPTVAPGVTPMTAWVNSVNLRLGKTSGTANVVLHIKRVDAATGKPKGADIDSVTILGTSIPTIATATTQPPWSNFAFSGAVEFGPNDKIAICIAQQSASGNYYIGCDTGGTNQSPSDQASVKNTGAGNDLSWQTPSTTLDILCEVKGQYTNIAGLVAPTLDSATTLTIATGAGSTSHSFSVTIGSNGNDAGCLWACSAEGQDQGSVGDVCSGMTYAGVPGMEILYTDKSNNGDYVKWFRWLKPPIGTANIVATYPGSNHRGAIVALSYFDINQSQPEGGNVVYFLPYGLAPPPTAPLIGDINLVGQAWYAFSSSSAASPASNTTTLGGSQTGPPGDGTGAVVGYSTGDVQTGYQLSGAGVVNSDTPPLGIIGILSTTGLHSQFAPPPPDYSQYPKQLLRTVADPDIHNDPDDGI